MDVKIIGYKSYITRSGDTYDMLAIALYDDEKKASFIIKANPKHMGTLIFEAGVKLRIPILDIIDIPETLPPWRR